MFDALILSIKEEYNIGGFEWFSDIRQDEYIELKESEKEKIGAGVIVKQDSSIIKIDSNANETEIKNPEVHSQENAQIKAGEEAIETKNSDIPADVRSAEEEKIMIEYSKIKIGNYTIERYPIEDGKVRIVIKMGGDIMGLIYPSPLYPDSISNEYAIEQFNSYYPQMTDKAEKENHIVSSLKSPNLSISEEKKYFQEKLKAVKISKKFANEEDKAYFSEIEKAIKISLRYL